MDRLDSMTLFVAALEGGSLAEAARRHGRSPAAVTRAVAGLERLAGEPLLLRSTRRLGLTRAGERHLAVWRDVLARLDELAPSHAGAPLQGCIRLTAPELFGRLHVMPAVEAFLATHPKVSVRVRLVNRLVDLVEEGVDLAVRLAPLADSSFTAIKLGNVQEVLCASPAYLERSGLPATPSELRSHACIGLDPEAEGERWFFLDAPAGRRSLRIVPRLSVDHAAAGIDAALRGGGVIRARSYQVADHLAAGRLVRLLRSFESDPTPVHLVLPAGRATTGAVRALIDVLVPTLKRQLSDVEVAVEQGGDAAVGREQAARLTG